MLTSDYDKYICNKYGVGARSETGEVNCKQCPLLIDAKEHICKATAHYDASRSKWIKDRK